MKSPKIVLLISACGCSPYGRLRRIRDPGGFRATDQPSAIERVMARTVRNLGIPQNARNEKNPWTATPALLEEARENFIDHCAGCHGKDGDGRSGNRPESLSQGARFARSRKRKISATARSTTSFRTACGLRECRRWEIRTAARTTTSPGNWFCLFAPSSGQRHRKKPNRIRQRPRRTTWVPRPARNATGRSTSAGRRLPWRTWCAIPREHPDAIIPNLATNNVSPKFTKDQVAFVYGSIWKQRYFTKIGDDYFPEPAQWDITNKAWKPYFVPKGGDWWEPFYPPDNRKRPTGPTCDGCHSVDYNIQTKQVAEWNVGCERCHGPGSAHVERAMRGNILNPARMDYVSASDTCIQCHSQGRPLTNPIEGQYYDWPVGYQVGLNLRDYWQLEDHKLGELSFTHFPDGTAHKNRMQGNDFVQSVMYRRGVTCFDCHDVHGTKNYAQLRKPVNEICLDCHGPGSRNGPRETTLAEHTHHKDGSAGCAHAWPATCQRSRRKFPGSSCALTRLPSSPRP